MSRLLFPWSLFACLMLTSNCTRTVTTKKRSYSISGSGAEANDSDELKKRYASGFEIGEDGTMQSNKKDLYVDQSYNNTKGNSASLKTFRQGKGDMDMKEFRTPEYLNRQKDYRTKESNISKNARESDVDRFTSSYSTEEARINNKTNFFDWLNPFSKNKEYQGADKSYRTSFNRNAHKSMQSAPTPEPMGQVGASPQDQRNSSLSMDDVKKMLNPAGYQRQP